MSSHLPLHNATNMLQKSKSIYYINIIHASKNQMKFDKVEVQTHMLTFNVYLFPILKSIGDNYLIFVTILQNKKFPKVSCAWHNLELCDFQFPLLGYVS